jgi:predicted membrane protein
MDKVQIKSLIKCVIWGGIWPIILVLIGLLIVNFTTYNLKDVLFIEGIILVILGGLSLVGGNPLGLSLQAMGQNSAQYVANANLEVTKMEKEKNTNRIKSNLRTSINMVSLIIGGVICIVINFIL